MTETQPEVASNRRLFVTRLAAVLFAIGISAAIYLLRDHIADFKALGYPGIFLVTLFSNATVFLPVPGVLFTSLMGAMLNPFLVAIVAGAGAALGELSGYLVGFGGQVVLERTNKYPQIEGWVKRYGQWAILVLSFIPNPFFDLAGMAAGMLKMSVWKFLLFCWIGSTAKMLVFAYGGATIRGFLNL